MILQRIVFSSEDETEKALFVRKKQGNHWCFDTYFNIFDCAGWRKYTEIRQISLRLSCDRVCTVVMNHISLSSMGVDGMAKRQIAKVKCHAAGEEEMIGPIDLPVTGAIAFEVIGAEDSANCPVIKASWITSESLQQIPVEIGIGICTYKREAYVQKNLDRLQKELLDDPEAPGYGHIRVCVADNGNTLMPETAADSSIRIVPNRNLGGAGGFTRTMIEYLQSGNVPTHILLMDDDAVIFPSSVERTWTFLSLLKPEYRSHVICGSLFREDLPAIQTESGARWHRGDVESLGANIDMTDPVNVIRELREREIDYSGWWYSCIPVPLIKSSGLPLPIFVHRDDIEYGLRASGFIRLNGVCVRHEAFDNKMPGAMEYYDIRNLGIVNAIHYEDFNVLEFDKQLLIMVMSNLLKFRYRYAMMNLKGAADFLKGAEGFLKKDGEALHAGLAFFNYKTLSEKETKSILSKYGKKDFRKQAFLDKQQAKCSRRLRSLLTLNGTFFPCPDRQPEVTVPWPELSTLYKKNIVIYVDNNDHATAVKRNPAAALRVCKKTVGMLWLSVKHFNAACESWRAYQTLMTSEDYWHQILHF